MRNEVQLETEQSDKPLLILHGEIKTPPFSS